MVWIGMGLVACNSGWSEHKKDDPWYYNSKKESYRVSVLPTSEDTVEYDFSYETIMLVNQEDTTHQKMDFEFFLKNSVDSFVLIPDQLALTFQRPDGSSYIYDSKISRDSVFLLKDLTEIMDQEMSIFTHKNRSIAYLTNINHKTQEIDTVLLTDRYTKSIFASMVVAMLDFVPMQEVKIGQTWKSKRDIVLMGYNLLKKSNFTLIEVDDQGVATIVENTILTNNPSDQTSMEEFNMKVKINGSSEAYYIVDLNKGVLNSSDINTQLHGTIQTTSAPIPISIQSKRRFNHKF